MHMKQRLFTLGVLLSTTLALPIAAQEAHAELLLQLHQHILHLGTT